jgi:polar amino acid transport system substrate-binding protein
MNYKNDAGELIGFETEFAKAVCAELGIKATFQEISWNAKETELAAKNIDCIWNGMTINEERSQNMSITIPYMTNKQVMVVKAK